MADSLLSFHSFSLRSDNRYSRHFRNIIYFFQKDAEQVFNQPYGLIASKIMHSFGISLFLPLFRRSWLRKFVKWFLTWKTGLTFQMFRYLWDDPKSRAPFIFLPDFQESFWNCKQLLSLWISSIGTIEPWMTIFLIADDVTFEFPFLIPVCCNTAGGHWC